MIADRPTPKNPVHFDHVGQVVTWLEPTYGVPAYFVGRYFRVVELSEDECVLAGPYLEPSCQTVVAPEPERIRSKTGKPRALRTLKEPLGFTMARSTQFETHG